MYSYEDRVRAVRLTDITEFQIPAGKVYRAEA
jgi:hypothetical protein